MLLSAASILLATLVSAHRGCGGQEVQRRNPGGRLIQRQVTDEASAAQSIDVGTECTPYSYAPVMSLKASMPPIWQTATLVPGDTAAQTAFMTINNTIASKFPNTGPHGTTNGNFAGVNYSPTDPDCWWTWRGCDTPAADTGLPADITTVPEPMTWGLGFDDGPNCSHNALYDVLAENNQKATMFYIGSNVMDWPLQALRAVKDGHEICVHTWSHQYMTSFSNEQAFAELYYTRQALTEILGVTPKCWRPPYGDVDNRIRYIAQQLNLTTIVWSDDTEDWKEGVPADNVTSADVTANYQKVISNISSYSTHGPVVLNHELTNYTMSEFVAQYANIKSAFKYIVPLCTALNITNPYAELNITCPDFATYIAGMTNTSASATQVDMPNTVSATGAQTTMTTAGSSPSGTGTGTGTATDSGNNNAAAASGTKTAGAGKLSFSVGHALVLAVSALIAVAMTL